MEQEQSRSMRMFQIMDRLRRAWSEFHPSTDLNKSQLGTLLILRHGTEKPCAPAQQTQHKPMTMSELAARMGQSMPAVSQRISKLEAMGYVRRQSDPRDRRTTWIHLTDAGIEAEDFGGSDCCRARRARGRAGGRCRGYDRGAGGKARRRRTRRPA